MSPEVALNVAKKQAFVRFAPYGVRLKVATAGVVLLTVTLNTAVPVLSLIVVAGGQPLSTFGRVSVKVSPPFAEAGIHPSKLIRISSPQYWVTTIGSGEVVMLMFVGVKVAAWAAGATNALKPKVIANTNTAVSIERSKPCRVGPAFQRFIREAFRCVPLTSPRVGEKPSPRGTASNAMG
ncbi:MAG: hypothetical protein V9F00_12585 [Nocardioides sp.]